MAREASLGPCEPEGALSSSPEWITPSTPRNGLLAVLCCVVVAGIAAARVKEIGFVSARVIELPEKCPL